MVGSSIFICRSFMKLRTVDLISFILVVIIFIYNITYREFKSLFWSISKIAFFLTIFLLWKISVMSLTRNSFSSGWISLNPNKSKSPMVCSIIPRIKIIIFIHRHFKLTIIIRGFGVLGFWGFGVSQVFRL